MSTLRPPTDIVLDEVLLDQLERLRTGANTHVISNLRQSYLGSFELCRLRNGSPGEALPVDIFRKSERKIHEFIAGLRFTS